MRYFYLLLFLSFSGSRTPSQRTVDSAPSTTDILTASSLHLPHIPSAANSNGVKPSGVVSLTLLALPVANSNSQTSV